MKIVEVKGKNLPNDTTHGFKILKDDATLLFFHWHEDGQIIIPDGDVFQELADSDRANEAGRKFELLPGPEGTVIWREPAAHERTTYAQVLEAIPKRLSEMGLESEIDSIMDEVQGRFGKGS